MSNEWIKNNIPVKIKRNPIEEVHIKIVNGNKINILLQSNLKCKKIELFDLTGKTIYQNSVSTSNFIKLEASYIKHGIYVLRLILNNGIYTTKIALVNI